METLIPSRLVLFFRRFYTILQKGCLDCTDLSRDIYLAESKKECIISDEMADSKKEEQLLIFIYRTQKTVFYILLNGRYPPVQKLSVPVHF